MDTAPATAKALAARANAISTEAMDAWKLGALSASVFAEVAGGCDAALRDYRTYQDEPEAVRLLDEASALLNYMA